MTVSNYVLLIILVRLPCQISWLSNFLSWRNPQNSFSCLEGLLPMKTFIGLKQLTAGGEISYLSIIVRKIYLYRSATHTHAHTHTHSHTNMYMFNVVCTVHHPTICIWTNKMHKILVIRLYFLLDALHVSDYIIPSSGATFISCTSQLVYAGICRYHMSGCCVAIATQQPETKHMKSRWWWWWWSVCVYVCVGARCLSVCLSVCPSSLQLLKKIGIDVLS